MKMTLSLQSTILTLTGLLAGWTSAWADNSDIAILSAKDDMPQAWTATGWGGLPVETNPQGGRTPDSGYVGSTVDPKAQPYSGIALGVGMNTDIPSNCVPLTSDAISKDVVEMYLSSGKPWSDAASGGAHIKVFLMFVTKDGKTVAAPADDIPVLDSDSKKWTQIRIPLAQLVGKLADPKSIVGLSDVSIQYIDQPTSEVRVSECYLKAK